MPRHSKRPGPPPSSVVATGQPYGQAGEQEDFLRQTKQTVAQQDARQPRPANPADILGAATAFTPPPMTPLGAPSTRPGEPVTAGLDIGAGPGSDSLPGYMAPPNSAQELRDAYRRFPSEALRELIEELELDEGGV